MTKMKRYGSKELPVKRSRESVKDSHTTISSNELNLPKGQLHNGLYRSNHFKEGAE